MPSPLAHSAVAVLLAPALLRDLPPEASRARKVALVGGVIFGTVAADLDIALGFARGVNGFAVHGEFTHSLLMMLVFATIFAAAARWIAPVHLGRAWVIGALSYGSHLLLDALNHGRGIMLFWPISSERYASPIRLFYGVRHSDPTQWTHHIMTLATELLFVAMVLALAAILHARRKTAHRQPAPARDRIA